MNDLQIKYLFLRLDKHNKDIFCKIIVQIEIYITKNEKIHFFLLNVFFTL